MSRRRQKNNLLPKMIGIAVVINAILLPILAHMGVFKAIRGQRLEPVKLVELPPQKKPPVPKKTPKKAPPHKHTPRPAARAASHPATARPSRPNPNQPKLVVSAGGGSGGGPGIENNGTGAAGQLPSGPPPVANPVPTNPALTPPTNPTPTVPTPVPAPPVKPDVTPQAPLPPPPHVPVVVAAEPVAQPQPKIPDDLSSDSVHGDFKAVFTIRADGAVSVQMTASTGNSTLDALALDAARRWTFRPATVDGRPVSSFRRFAIQFEST